MKKLITFSIIVAAIFYFLFAFAHWNLNPTYWGYEPRAYLAIVYCTFQFGLIYGFLKSKLERKKSNS